MRDRPLCPRGVVVGSAFARSVCRLGTERSGPSFARGLLGVFRTGRDAGQTALAMRCRGWVSPEFRAGGVTRGAGLLLDLCAWRGGLGSGNLARRRRLEPT